MRVSDQPLAYLDIDARGYAALRRAAQGTDRLSSTDRSSGAPTRFISHSGACIHPFSGFYS
jgi:hypothetical protein